MTTAGPYIGPKGGKWRDAKHTIPWKEPSEQKAAKHSEMSRGEAALEIINSIPKNVRAGWLRNADRAYKDSIAEAIDGNSALRNASLNIFHQQYQIATDKQISFDEFLDTPIELHRAGVTPATEAFSSYSFDKEIAERFGKQYNVDVHSITVKPRDTYGMINEMAEGEVLVPLETDDSDKYKQGQVLEQKNGTKWKVTRREGRQVYLQRTDKPDSKPMKIHEQKLSAKKLFKSIKARTLAQAWRDIIKKHHEAILIETLGVDAAGVPPERVQEMIDDGTIDPKSLRGVLLPGMKNDVNPLSFMYRVATIAEQNPGQRAEMRLWSIDRWQQEVDKHITEAPESPVNIPRLAAGVGVSVEKPEPPPKETGPGAPTVSDVEPPDYLSDSQKAAYQAAAERAGQYCRGLGNVMADSGEVILAETWEGEDIQEEADIIDREDRVATIRDKVTEALATHQNSGELAADLARTTGMYSHNWHRIAKTEIQGAYNEGVILEAIDHWGAEARIARITETNACEHCLRLFRNSDGSPVVFSVQELLANGTNVGKTARSWVPTVWPVHPNCRCDTLNVPPDASVSVDGVLKWT